MNGAQRPLDNPINWSFRIGRLWSIDIRMHIAFVICAVVLIWMELPEKGSDAIVPIGRVFIDALGIYAILFFIVLVHEFGHCYGARKTGGEADEILLWPLGGLASVNPPHEASAHMITAAAGPMVNVLFCAIGAGVLTVWIGSLGAVPWNPLHPMWPVDQTIIPTTAQVWVLRFYGLSYFILLINLLPIFPFDGGRILQAWLWPRKGYHSSMTIATGTGMVGAILVGLFGLFMAQGWLVIMIAVFGYLTCYQTRRRLKEEGELTQGEFGYDFSKGYTSFDGGENRERRPGFFERRRARRAAARAERERQEREARDQDVERVLRKISESGTESLTARERRLLEEETERQRASKQ